MTASSFASTQPHPVARGVRSLRGLSGTQEGVLAISLLFLMVSVGGINPRFSSPTNLASVFSFNAYVAVAAIGMSMVIISGNIDISVGPLISALGLLCGTLATSGFPVWVAWVAPLFGGALVGLLIGFLVAYVRIPSIVVSLGFYSIIKGLIVIIAGSKVITGMPPDFGLAQLDIFGIPMSVVFMVVLTVLTAIWMRYSGFSRSIYAVGGNAEAARLSGIDTRRVVLLVFVLNGVFVGIASTLLATQFSQIQATPPPGLELLIITSAVVGGVSILGGTGTVIGAMLAAILLSAIRNALTFLSVSNYWIQAVQGVLILITVLADILRRRRQRRLIRT